jgi:outer membrane lipoprotein LolB
MNKLFLGLNFILLSLIFFLLSSCATVSTIQPQNPKASQHWRLQGKIAMEDNGKMETASLDWQQNYQQYQIRIFGPLGLGAVELNGDSQGVALTDNKGQLHQAASVEALSQQILGYPLPINDLVFWL